MKVALLGNLVLKLMVGMFRPVPIFSSPTYLFSWFSQFTFKVASHRFDNYRYTFCGFATMILINEVNRLDLAGLLVRHFYLSLW
jgi:hypothetical protein